MAIKKISKTEINNIVNIESVKKTTNIEITNTEDTFKNERFYFTDIYDDKKYNKFIKACEKLIRTSVEYKKYIGYLKEKMGLINCSVLGNIDDSMADLEFHHFPFTLYDIVSLHIAKNFIEGNKFNTFSIANDVLKEHYENIIGLVSLSKTAHQLVHAGELTISTNQIFGEVSMFVDKYRDYLTDDMIYKYNQLLTMSKESENIYKNNTIINSIGFKNNSQDEDINIFDDNDVDMDRFLDKS